MGKLNNLKETIENLRMHLNKAIENKKDGKEILIISQQLDELLVDYYTVIKDNKKQDIYKV